MQNQMSRSSITVQLVSFGFICKLVSVIFYISPKESRHKIIEDAFYLTQTFSIETYDQETRIVTFAIYLYCKYVEHQVTWIRLWTILKYVNT